MKEWITVTRTIRNFDSILGAQEELLKAEHWGSDDISVQKDETLHSLSHINSHITDLHSQWYDSDKLCLKTLVVAITVFMG